MAKDTNKDERRAAVLNITGNGINIAGTGRQTIIRYRGDDLESVSVTDDDGNQVNVQTFN